MKKYFNKVCKVCDYKWKARIETPRQCPNCKRQIKYKNVFSKKEIASVYKRASKLADMALNHPLDGHTKKNLKKFFGK